MKELQDKIDSIIGCEHNVITITDRDEGICADCGTKMMRIWQPNCG